MTAVKAKPSPAKPLAKTTVASSAKPTSRPSSKQAKAPVPIDYSEEKDLPEPEEDDVEQQLRRKQEQQEEDRPCVDLSFDLINQTQILQELQAMAGIANRADLYKQLTHLRLDRLRLGSLSVEVFLQLPALTHLYLQHNKLPGMAAVSALSNLKFLTLAFNDVAQVDGVAGLPRLMFMDVSHNLLTHLAPNELPQSLRFLQIEGNPCCQLPTAKAMVQQLIAHIPLKYLDRDVYPETRQRARKELDLPPEPIQVRSPTASDDGMGDDGGLDGLDMSDEESGSEAAGGGQEAEGPLGINLDSALDMLDEMERSCVRHSMSHFRASLRASLDRSALLRVSMEKMKLQGHAPPRASTASRPSTAASMDPPMPSAAPSAIPANGLALLSTAPSANMPRTPSGRLLRSLSPLPDSPAIAAAAAAAASGSPFSSRPGSSRAGPGPGAAGDTQGSRPASGRAADGGSSGSIASAFDLLSSRPGSSTAGSVGLQRRSSGLTGAAAGAGPGAVEPASSSLLEQQVQADMEALNQKMQAWLEMGAGGSPQTVQALVSDATAPIRSQRDRILSSAKSRLSQQREADAALSSDIKLLRASGPSGLAQIRKQPGGVAALLRQGPQGGAARTSTGPAIVGASQATVQRPPSGGSSSAMAKSLGSIDSSGLGQQQQQGSQPSSRPGSSSSGVVRPVSGGSVATAATAAGSADPTGTAHLRASLARVQRISESLIQQTSRPPQQQQPSSTALSDVASEGPGSLARMDLDDIEEEGSGSDGEGGKGSAAVKESFDFSQAFKSSLPPNPFR